MGIFVDKVPAVSHGDAELKALITDRFTFSRDYAATAYSNTVGYIADMVDLLDNLSVPVSPDIDVDEPSVPEIVFSERPALGDLSLPSDWLPSPPAPPSLGDVPDMDDITIPVMSVTVPDWNTPDKPEVTYPPDIGDAPVLDMPVVPPAPPFTLPTAPTLNDLVIPSAPEVSVPEFDISVIPEEFMDIPQGFSWEESPYNSDVWNSLLTEVLEALEGGAQAYGGTVEQEIFDRHLNRTQDENDKLYRDVEGYFAARGWGIPPGAMTGLVAEIAQQISRNNEEASGKIMIEQAEIAFKNYQFMMDKGVQIETILREFHNAQMNRSLEAAKVLVTSAIEVYNAYVAKFNSRLEQYKVQAQVYEARIRAALSAVEIFKAQVEGVRVSAEVQRTLVAIYEAQVSAIEVSAKLYATQLEGVKLATEIERSKMEVFELRTKIYLAQLEMERLKVAIYEAENEAEKSKAQVYSEQVRAYVAEVEATKARRDIQLGELEVVLKQNQILVERYRSELAGYTTQIEAQKALIDANVEGFKAEVAGYSAETEAIGMQYSTTIKLIEARIQAARFNVEKALAEIDAVTKGYIAISELQVKGTEATMNVGAQLAASAWSAANASVTGSLSDQQNYGKQYTLTNTLSEAHNFEEE